MRNYFQVRLFLIVIAVSFSAFSVAQPAPENDDNLPTDYLSKDFHAGRRAALREIMPNNSVMVVLAYPERTFSEDITYFYHQNPDMYYFTGYKEPHSLLLVFKENQISSSGESFNEILFVQERNPQREQWDGRRLGTDGVNEKLGFKTVMNGKDFKDFVIDFSKFDKIILSQLPADVKKNRYEKADLFSLIQQFKEKSAMPEQMTKQNKFDYRLYQDLTAQLREIKTPEEINLLRKAIEISCYGQNEVMKTVRPDMSELEIQGLHEYVHKRYGAEGVGYGSIIGSGENGCILHYMENTKTKIGTSMLLMDVGAEYHGYTADVTRTIPVDGKFSKEEKAIYQLVYDAQEAAFKTLKDGSKWMDATNAARNVIADGLIKLGIITNKNEVSKYYPHGLGHHIGLDVHDRGFYENLKKDMVITIEPGIYIPEGSKCDKKWWSIAVRIEDDLLITQNGYELLSHFAPRKIEDIEKIIAQKSVLDNYKLPPLKSGQKKGF
ncbi:MAG: aminopeptidase P family protein [Chitinophagaceae bacterium]|jgi:Xaa-Pro aminopeptidase|nr:aminopeptidase P family protein [Chitinophagaceae bacterium]MBK7679430.1 aminopeptidase P family protein [Chitinophagaceae bacterium]MBK8299222.1 aminopeptidase P family protein [Chitinophagaceae bacterium]MBK9463274.1 aminopeptidase P family protein [Chitinophagaceae bacterium]MBP6232472.1 aminopeptidase P family protein [Chitinophagaceae bacterium]